MIVRLSAVVMQVKYELRWLNLLFGIFFVVMPLVALMVCYCCHAFVYGLPFTFILLILIQFLQWL